jgi:hypothetical protein
MHDFEAVGDPIYAGDELVLAHASIRRAREMEDDLGFDARFRQAC